MTGKGIFITAYSGLGVWALESQQDQAPLLAFLGEGERARPPHITNLTQPPPLSSSTLPFPEMSTGDSSTAAVETATPPTSWGLGGKGLMFPSYGGKGAIYLLQEKEEVAREEKRKQANEAKRKARALKKQKETEEKSAMDGASSSEETGAPEAEEEKYTALPATVPHWFLTKAGYSVFC